MVANAGVGTIHVPQTWLKRGKPFEKRTKIAKIVICPQNQAFIQDFD